MEKKVCIKCKEEKNWDEFYAVKHGCGKVRGSCKVCDNERNKSRYIVYPATGFTRWRKKV